MDLILMVLLVLFWSSGLQAEEIHNQHNEPVRLVGGSSRCTGTLEMKHKGEWRPACGYHGNLKKATVVCRELDCGSVVSIVEKEHSSHKNYLWWIRSDCVHSGSALRDCVTPSALGICLEITCSDSVRLVNGTSLCSGRLEVKSNQSNQWWSSVCEADFDQQDAEVVCRELGCGAPSVLQGALYGEVETPTWTKEFQCGGHESGLLDCRSSGSDRNTCSPGKAVGLTCSEPVRLVGGSSRCTGSLEMKHQKEWRAVLDFEWSLKDAALFCRKLDCGSAISTRQRKESSVSPVWWIKSECIHSESVPRDCAKPHSSSHILDITCSDSVRLVNGTSLCSGRLEVKSNQSNQWWSSVCEADFDQQDAEVVCRELGCGAPSVLQGALYGEVEAPTWTKEFQCGGHESALLDCRSSGSDRNTCSPGKAVGLTCSEPVRLVGGSSRCTGSLEVNQGGWRPVDDWNYDWTLKEAAVFCRELECGSAVSARKQREYPVKPLWTMSSDCLKSGSAVRDCVTPYSSSDITEITCSDSVRLVNGTSLCSGRLEVKSNQSNQSNQWWSSVCEADFDQQDAEVVCRELGCGAPSVLQGALYGEVETPTWTREFQCGGHESALLDCRSSGSDRNTCSPGKAVGLTCSEPVRLVGGSSRCTGTLEMKHQKEWRAVYSYHWTRQKADVFCRELDCGSVVSTRRTKEFSRKPMWWIKTGCVHYGSFLRDCLTPYSSSEFLEITCSNSVRLVNGTSVCSGRLEVKSNQSNQWWSSVCEADFDQQDAEVVCRELGCGAPSVLQGALYGEVEAPTWTKEFQCGGHESALLDCRSSGSDRNTCSPGKAVGLTCSEPVRLVGGSSRCTGSLEINQGEWRPVASSYWALKEAAVFCRELDCGSAVSTGWRKMSSDRPVWKMTLECAQSGSALRDCVTPDSSSDILEITCSDSVRLVNGTSLCSGRLEVMSNQTNQSNQWWSSVCEADFDQQDAEVVCRELGCGAPSVLQGALYGEVEAPTWTKEFQCGGHESALLDCRSSGSDRNTCSPGKAVGLTCSEPVRLVGGSSRCIGTLEMKHQKEWRPVKDWSDDWTLKEAAVFCRELDCGSAVSIRWKKESSERQVWRITSYCLRSQSFLRDCVRPESSLDILEITCSDSVRLVNGTSLCSGRLEVKSNQTNQSNQWWSSVCEADFDQQDAEVVCRELGCGAPSVLQGALFGDVEAPTWTKEFQCGGHESALLDCRSSGSDRNTCSPGKAVGLTCSEPVRLVGGSSRCTGTLEMKQGDWRPVDDRFYDWTLKEAAVFCRELECGSAVSARRRKETSDGPVWHIRSDYVKSGSAAKDSVQPGSSNFILELSCSDSVRLVNGTSLCSGRLEVKSNQSNQWNQWWSSVCEADFDQQDAEVVCRELGCGAPSVLQGALYGEVEAPTWTKEFQCGGHESALLDCRSSGSDRNTCSPGKAVGLTCSEPVRLVGGSSRCTGTLEVNQGDWRPVDSSDWTAVFCRGLDCGSAVSIRQKKESSERPVWKMTSECIQSGSVLRDCLRPGSSSNIMEITCSDSVRLVNGTSLCSGRLEVKTNQTNQTNQWWSSVCEADFDQQDAEVVCRELGCGAPSVLQGALFGEVEAPTWTREFQCGGHESALLDCRSSGSDRNTCSPGKAVGLTCSEPVRLVGGSSRCTGTLEMKHQKEWRAVTDWNDEWTLKEAAVFCRELDCGSAVSAAWRKESTKRPVWKITSECIQSGSALRDCIKPDSSFYFLDITCLDLLVQPDIAVSTTDGVSEAHQQGFQVIRGSIFTISCSIQPQYPGGSFLLAFTSSNSAHNYTQKGVNHSAHFLFPAADPTHQGSYSCVYHIYVYSHNILSASRLLSLSVSDLLTETLSLSVSDLLTETVNQSQKVSVFTPVFIFALILLLLSLMLYIAGIYSSCKATRGQKSEKQMDTEML